MIKPLLPSSDPLLRKVMPPFSFSSEDATEIATALTDAMLHHGGIGLAANQIGINTRAFAMMVNGQPIVLFNPLITWISIDTNTMVEGCLSFSGLWLSVARPKECQISFTTHEGKRVTLDLKDVEARTALHEIDHLDGLVFTSKVSKLRLAMAKKRAKKHLTK